MTSRPGSLADITAELFRRLERNKLRYAVLRNYERFPHLCSDVTDHALTDVDLVMDSDDVPAWRNLALSLAEDCGWDVLTECSHFCVSRIPEHRIDIFRFYRLSPPACLQVDVFHGFLLWGVPFIGEEELLESRFPDAQLKLTRISCSTENVLRMLQLHSLLAEHAREDKLERYRFKVLQQAASDHAGFRQELRAAFSTPGEKALEALNRGDWAGFRNAMRNGKTVFLARFCLKHPLRTAHCTYERFRDHFVRFITRQCGFVLNCYAPSDRERTVLETALDDLKVKKILPAWTKHGADRRSITWPEHRVMERGGVALKWCEEGRGVDVGQAADERELTSLVLWLLINRHPALYRRMLLTPASR